jgi:two-component system sensor histidine kinase GlrK
MYTISEVGNYAERSQAAIFKAVHETESSRIILERLASMERNIRQIQLFGKSDFYDLYQENRDKFLKEIASLKPSEMDERLVQQLNSLKDTENKVYHYILANLKGDEIKLSQENLNAFDQLTRQARVVLAEGEQRIETEATALSAKSEKLRMELIYLAFISIFFASIIAVIFVRLLLRPIKDIAQAIRILGEVGFDQAISIRGPRDLQKLGSQLEWLRQKLDNLENEKQQFIRNVSHELKTPLATLKEGTDLLSENVVGELNTEQQDIIQLMKMGNITIHDLVENLLEYQRTISTKIVFNCSTFKLETLISRVTDEYELLLRSKNITLKSNLHSTQINADYDKLRIIISNLFSNALKFSPQNGSIGLTLSSQDNIINLIIEDQGSGIAKEIQSLIFKDFYYGNSTPDWKIKASGLGLALVKHYLDAHNGSIELLPATGNYCGARFSIHLPQNQGNKKC